MYEAYNQSMWVSDGQGGMKLRYPRCGQMIPEELGGGDFSLFFPEGQTREFYVNQESNVQYFRVVQGQLKRLWSATLIEEHTSAVDVTQYEQLKKQARSRSTSTSVFLKAVSDGAQKTWLTNECGVLPEDHRILDRFSFGHWSSRILPDGTTVCLQRTGEFVKYDPFEKTFRDRLSCKEKP